MRFVPYIYPDLPEGNAYYQEPHDVLRVRRRQLGMSMQLTSNRANMNYVKYRVYERGDLKLEKGETKMGWDFVQRFCWTRTACCRKRLLKINPG